MTLHEFNRLEFNNQLEIVWDIGIFLDNFKDSKERGNCYAIDKFFVELVYNGETNTINEIRCFKTVKNIDKYSISFKNYCNV